MGQLGWQAAGAGFLARWVTSAKDDLLGDDDVNPVTLIGKLCAFVAAGVAVGVAVVGVVRWVA